MVETKVHRGPKSGIALDKGVLKALRIAARMTQEDLAVGSGLSLSTVTRAERGRKIDIDTAAVLSAALSEAIGRNIDLADPPDVVQLQRQLAGPRYLSPLLELERTIHGRSELTEEIRKSLERHLVATLTPSAVLTGGGGIGKTAMARLYAASSRAQYNGIWWLPSATRPQLLEGYRQLADRIGFSTSGDDAAIARRTIRHVEESGKLWLLIFDNVSSPSLLVGLMPMGRHVHRIVTSRFRSWGRNYERIDIDVLDFATAGSPAVDVLMDESGRTDDREGAWTLASRLGGLPLALVCAGGWLREQDGESFASFGNRLDEIIARRPISVGDYDHSVIGCIMLSIDNLTVDAQMLLDIISWLDPDMFTTSDLQSLPVRDQAVHWKIEALPLPLHQLLSDRTRLDDALAGLERISLITRFAQSSFRIHRITQSVVRHLQAHERLKWFTATASLIAAKYPSGPSEPQYAEHWPSCRALHGHVLALFDAEFHSSAAGYLFNQANRYLDTRGHYRDSIKLIMRSIHCQRRRHREESLEFAEALANLAIGMFRTNRPRFAERFARRSLEISERIPGLGLERRADRHSLHGIMLDVLARMYEGPEREQGLARSVKQKQMAIALERQAGNRRHQRFAIRVSNLGTTRQNQQRHGASVRLHLASMKLRAATLDPDEPENAFGPANAGGALLDAGFANQLYRGWSGVDLLRDALERRQRAFPEDPQHPLILQTARWLAAGHLARSRLRSGGADGHDDVEATQTLVEMFELDLADVRNDADRFVERAVNRQAS